MLFKFRSILPFLTSHTQLDNVYICSLLSTFAEGSDYP